MLRLIPIILPLLFTGCSLIPLRCVNSDRPDMEVVKEAMRQRAEAIDRMNREAAEGWIIDDYQAALIEAKETNTPIFVDFSGYTCTNCRWMERNVFTKPRVKDLFHHYVLVRLFTDKRDSINGWNRQMHIDRFNTIDLPLYAVISPADSVIATHYFNRDTAEFIAFLRKGLGE